jgi:DNA-directed RNA polymerase specialized sigma24 family protein
MSDHRAGYSDPRKVEAGFTRTLVSEGERRRLDGRCSTNIIPLRRASYSSYQPISAMKTTEEICQETFLAVERNLGSFQGKSSFQTWLLRIAANKAMDFRGKSRAGKRGGSFVHFSLDGTDEHEQIDLPSRGPGPDALLANAETCRLVRQSSINWMTTAVNH